MNIGIKYFLNFLNLLNWIDKFTSINMCILSIDKIRYPIYSYDSFI